VYRRARQLGYPLSTYRGSSDLHSNSVTELCRMVSKSEESSRLDPNTMAEGIVIWFQDDFGNWIALKHKSDAFLEKTSKQMDEGTQDAEDYN